MRGVVYVKVALYLETDLTEEEVQEMVSEMDYGFDHKMISHTEIIEVE